MSGLRPRLPLEAFPERQCHLGMESAKIVFGDMLELLLVLNEISMGSPHKGLGDGADHDGPGRGPMSETAMGPWP